MPEAAAASQASSIATHTSAGCIVTRGRMSTVTTSLRIMRLPMEACKRLILPLLVLGLLAACLPKPDDSIEYLDRSETILIQVVQVEESDPDAPGQLRLPHFTLYGDGTFIYLDGDGSRYLEARLPDEAIRDLLEFAVDKDFMEFSYVQPQLERTTARPTTYVYFHTKGAANAVSIYALDSVLPEDAGKEWDQFRKLQDIVTRLQELDPVALDGSEPQTYVPDAVLLSVQPADAPNVSGSPLIWTSPAIDLSEIAPPGSGRTERLLEGENAASLTGWLPTTRVLQGDRWFDVSYRPLLPFEENFPEFDTP